MARATANGYMKWMVDATPLAMCWYAMTRLNEVAARKRLNMNTVPKSFRLIQNVSPKKMPNMISVNDATPPPIGYILNKKTWRIAGIW